MSESSKARRPQKIEALPSTTCSAPHAEGLWGALASCLGEGGGRRCCTGTGAVLRPAASLRAAAWDRSWSPRLRGAAGGVAGACEGLRLAQVRPQPVLQPGARQQGTPPPPLPPRKNSSARSSRHSPGAAQPPPRPGPKQQAGTLPQALSALAGPAPSLPFSLLQAAQARAPLLSHPPGLASSPLSAEAMTSSLAAAGAWEGGAGVGAAGAG
jgi:hypothetical protein